MDAFNSDCNSGDCAVNVTMLDQYSSHSPDEAPAFAARTCYSDDDPTSTSFTDMIDGVDMDVGSSDEDSTTSDDCSEGAIADAKDVCSKDEQHKKLLKQLIRRGHFSVFEHTNCMFAISGISRVTMAQLTRHRHMSFSVQSQRYVNFDDAEMVMPPSYEDTTISNWIEDFPNDDEGEEITNRIMRDQLDYYNKLVDKGVPEEDARFALPIGTKVNMIVSGNARAWMHVLDLRTAGDSQWEIRELSNKILEGLKEWAPMTFELYEEHLQNKGKVAP